MLVDLYPIRTGIILGALKRTKKLILCNRIRLSENLKCFESSGYLKQCESKFDDGYALKRKY